MAADNLWQSSPVVPTLAYEDVPGAAEWLERVFGFIERSDARLTWDGGAMTWMEIGDSLINLSSSGGHGLESPKITGHAGHALKVYVDDVDEHFAHAKASGANIVSSPEDGFWGGRIYRATDLEGHHWEFSQKCRGPSGKRLAVATRCKHGSVKVPSDGKCLFRVKSPRYCRAILTVRMERIADAPLRHSVRRKYARGGYIEEF